MGTIRSGLLEKAEFGKFQKENQEALALLGKEKKDLRVKRKLKEAQTRAKQVKVKFQPLMDMKTGKPASGYRDYNPENLREAEIKVGNKVDPIRATYSYLRPDSDNRQTPIIKIEGLFDTKSAVVGGVHPLRKLEDPANKTFKPSQLKLAIDAVRKRYPKASNIIGERISGARKMSEDRLQRINLGKLGKKVKGKKLGLLGLGLSLEEAIRAGKTAYDAKEGKL